MGTQTRNLKKDAPVLTEDDIVVKFILWGQNVALKLLALIMKQTRLVAKGL